MTKMGKRDKEEAVDKENLAAEEVSNTAEQAEDTQNEEAETPELSKEEQLENKIAGLNDKYLRLYSDFENFRKRTIKEKGDLIMNASEGIVKDMLPFLMILNVLFPTMKHLMTQKRLKKVSN